MRPSSTRLVSKFVATYDRLFAGYTSELIAPNESPARFWANLLALQVDTAHLGKKIDRLRKEDILGSHKSLLNTLCETCILYLGGTSHLALGTEKEGYDRAAHSAETLGVVVRCVMEKGLDGWEVMEVLAGGVAKSDEVFLGLVNAIEEVLLDDSAPPTLKHAILRLALIFTSSIGQLSPSAYLLRKSLFPTLTGITKNQETREYTFEVVVLLSVLAGFHRTDAPRLNGYLREVERTEDREFLRIFIHTANYTMDNIAKAYQEIMDDSPPSFSSSVSNLLASFRPDRALSPTPNDTPKDLFKNQPIEAAVILFPFYDFLHLNTVFNAILIGPFISSSTPSTSQTTTIGKAKARASSSSLPPPLCTFLTLASYILTHATSVQSPRAAAYGNLCLATILRLVENDVAMSALVMPGDVGVRICRQRLPELPTGPNGRPVLCAVLDCCVLWLRHNLHRRLETQSYLICVWILQRVVWFLSKTRRRLEYHWEELWRSLILLLNFLSAKMPDSLKVEQLVQETVVLLDYSLSHGETFLGTAQDVHQIVYELVRSTVTLHNQHTICQKKPEAKRSLAGRHRSTAGTNPSVALRRLLDATSHYEQVIRDGGAKSSSAKSVLRAIAREVEKDGVVGAREVNDDEAPKRSDELGEMGFIRYAYADVLALMPGPDAHIDR